MIARMLAATILVLIATNAGAQSEDRKANREREMARRLQSQIQKLESEKAQLQQQNAEQLKQQQGDLDKKLKLNAGLQRQLAEAKKREDLAGRELQGLKDSLAEVQAKLAEQQSRYGEQSGQLVAATAEGKRLAAELNDVRTQLDQQREIIARQSKALQDVNDKNVRLYRLNEELLDRYNKKGVWDALLQREPLTQIKDVQAQALLQEYRDKLDELKIDKAEVGK